MDCNPLAAFRQGFYDCCQTAQDALMNTCDALLTYPQAHSFAALSLAPHFRRRWPSLYAALQDAQIDRGALRRLFATSLASAHTSPRWILGVDASPILRPLSSTAQDRIHLHSSAKSPTPGWSFSTVAVLPQPCSSWTYILDNQRIPSAQTPTQVAAAQLAAVVPLLPARPSGQCPLLLGDRYYGSAPFLQAAHAVPCDKLLRLQGHRVFYRAAPAPSGRPGAPRKDGARFKCSDPASHGAPDQQWQGTDAKARPVEVACWHHLHLKACRSITFSVLRVTRHSARDTKRDPRLSWFLWHSAIEATEATEAAEAAIPLAQIPDLYALRYGLEHGYRCDKGRLLWDKPRLRTPEQFQNWTDVVAATRNQLVLARHLKLLQPQPWERSNTAARRAVTPQQVRQALEPIIRALGTPAAACQPRGKSPGRPPGTKVQPAARFPVIQKTAPKKKSRRI